MATERIDIIIEADTKDASEWFKSIQKTARDTWKVLDQTIVKGLENTFWELKVATNSAREDLARLRKQSREGLIDPKKVKEAEIALNRLSSATTESRRQLQNYRNTWEANLSRLSSKFQDLRKDIVWQGWVLPAMIALTWAIWWLWAVWAKILQVEWFQKKLALQTNATAEETELLNKSIEDLANSGFVALEDNVKVLSALKREFNLVGDEATRLSKQYLALSDVFDKDVNEVLRASAWLSRNFWISLEKSNDIITDSLNRSWDAYWDILDTLNEYSVQAKQAWLTAQQFSEVLIKWSQDWAFNIDKIGDALKEARVSITTYEKSADDAFKKAWISYTDYIKRIDEGSITPIEAISEINEVILTLDTSLQNEVGTALYKSKWEDVWPAGVTALSNISTELDTVDWKTQDLAENLQTGLSAEWNKFKWQIDATTSESIPALTGALATLNVIFDNTGKVINVVKEEIRLLVALAWTWFLFLWQTIANVLFNAFNNIKIFASNSEKIFNGLKDVAVDIFSVIPEILKQRLNTVFKDIETEFNNLSIFWKSPNISLWSFDIDESKLQQVEKKIKDVDLDLDSFELDLNFDKTVKSFDQIDKALVDTWNAFRAFWEVAEVATKETETYSSSLDKTTKSTKDNTTTTKDNTKTIGDNTKAVVKNKEAVDTSEKDKQTALKKTLTLVKKEFKDAWNIIDTFVKDSKSRIDDFTSSITKAKDEISDINDALSDLESWRAETLTWRKSEIESRTWEIESTLQWFKGRDITQEEDESRVALKKELIELNKELALVNKNVSDEEIAEAERLKSLSPAELFLEWFEKEKKALEERKTKLEAQVIELQTQKDAEQLILEKFEWVKLKLAKNYRDEQANIESQITDNLVKELNKRQQALKDFQLDAEKIATSMREVWINIPTAEWSESPVSSNNSSSVNVWSINITESNNPDVTRAIVNQELIMASKNASKNIL